MLFDEFFSNDFFKDFFDGIDQQVYTAKKEEKCPVCGRTYRDFRSTGKFGCGECYKAFRPQVREVLKQIHSTAAHTGKVPSRAGEDIRKKRRYDELKRQLAQAVQKEDYDTAAKLHKQIRALESEGLK